MELLRDPIRLSFAFVGPVILMVAFGYGITFDVENLKYAAYDQDQTPESRRLLESFSGSRYFSERPPISSPEELDRRMRSGELALVVEIPSGFGRDLESLHSPEVGFWIDAAMPFRGETTQGYVTGSMLRYVQNLVDRSASAPTPYPSLSWQPQYRKSLSLQSGFQERLLHGSERHCDNAGSDPGDHGDDRYRAREGNRLDLQFSVHADQQIRIPPWQAVPAMSSSGW